ncbi:hypothetical protein MLD38_029013 [Melastoma candidum]|uniref:Uncharacterized protein n=1 Tax=Melastoma candidum TaxID=119954 RepID=A0ACB9N2U8_9MYRT|nr:hypothetical protein MLD38_029013 [Melastoma candidum]
MMRLHHRRRRRSPESVHLMRHNFSPTPVSFIIITHVPLSPNNFIHLQNNRDSHRFTSRAVLVPPSGGASRDWNRAEGVHALAARNSRQRLVGGAGASFISYNTILIHSLSSSHCFPIDNSVNIELFGTLSGALHG